MDFFAAEARAKKRTGRLLILFSLALGGTIAGGYFASVFILGAAGGYGGGAVRTARLHRAYSYSTNGDTSGAQPPLWQPQLFAEVALGTLAVVGLASLYKWSIMRLGGAAVAESVGGRRVDPHTTDLAERRLLNVVEEMSIAAGIPVPAVYLLGDEVGINAFAAGLTTSDAVVTVTQGALQRLTRDELQGVIGHEFSHILNGDMRTNMRLTALIFGILVLGLAGRAILWTMRYQRWGSSRDNKSGGGVILVGAIGLALLALGYIGYFFGRLIQAAVSRQREFLADASSVQFTRNPEGLSHALSKIGGLAIGSSLSTHRAAEIGHVFFAQASPSFFGGLWATHPPLTARILAIDPRFDGKFIEPPEVVDVATQSFVQAGLVPSAASGPLSAFAPPEAGPAPGAASKGSPEAFIARAGMLTPASIAHAQDLLDQLPDRLRQATRSAHDAPLLVFGLVLDDTDPAVRARQRQTVASRAGADAVHTLDELEPSLRGLAPEHKLPLLQLALPALKALPPTTHAAFDATLDELIRADGRVSIFEFALQKLIRRATSMSRAPGAAVIQIYSFQAVADEISAVLSAFAHASSDDERAVAAAFAAGAAQLRLLDGRLSLLPLEASDVSRLDAALDKLATASGPIKQRLLTAAAHVAAADGVFLVPEMELLRAVAATLDVPLPPLG